MSELTKKIKENRKYFKTAFIADLANVRIEDVNNLVNVGTKKHAPKIEKAISKIAEWSAYHKAVVQDAKRQTNNATDFFLHLRRNATLSDEMVGNFFGVDGKTISRVSNDNLPAVLSEIYKELTNE